VVLVAGVETTGPVLSNLEARRPVVGGLAAGAVVAGEESG